MKKVLTPILMLVFALGAFSASAAAPDGAAGPWADVATAIQGLRTNGTAVLFDRSNPIAALGAAETSGSISDVGFPAGSFFSLGFGGSLTLEFENGLKNGTGADVKIFEVTGGTYPEEKARVEASQNGEDWILLSPAVSRDAEVELGELSCARFIRLTDVSEKNIFEVTADGFDVDAVKALHPSKKVCRPALTGCVRSQGYWKNHSSTSKHPDPAWSAKEGEPFFFSGLSWIEVLHSSSAGGNAYFTLAHQYIAAHLNHEAGASFPPKIQTAFLSAQTIFAEPVNTAEFIGSLGSKNPLRKQMVSLAVMLEKYNTGQTAVPSCEESCDEGEDEEEDPVVPAPTVSGVSENGIYLADGSLRPTFENGTATLDEASFASGAPITALGDHVLKVIGSSTLTINFKVIVPSAQVIDPTPEKIEADIRSSLLSIPGADPENTPAATINTEYTLTTENFSLTFAPDTQITPAEGGSLDITGLSVEDIFQQVAPENHNSRGAVRVGIPNTGLLFSRPATITFPVNRVADGQSLKIYSRPDGAADWTFHGYCEIENSQCSFATDHATEFVGTTYVSNSPEPTDVNLDVNSTVTITCDESIAMNPITGTGQSVLDSSNDAECNIKTNNSAGYNLAWAASGAMEHILGSSYGTIAAYNGGTTPEDWDTAAADSEWGAHLMTTSTTVNTTTWGTDNTYGGGNWTSVPTEGYVIANRSDETSSLGDTEIVRFGAEVGSAHWQPTGTYDIDVVFTALTN